MKSSRVASKLLSILLLMDGTGAFAQSNASNILPNLKKTETPAEEKSSMAMFGGISDPQNGNKTAADYGIEYATHPYVQLRTALELNGSVFPTSSNTSSLTRTRIFAKAAYEFGGSTPFIKYSYVGAGVGPVFDNFNGSMDTELGFAPMIGFDIPLSKEAAPHLSVGANASYLFVGGAKPETLALDGVARYWF